jgi:hypothetical protein
MPALGPTHGPFAFLIKFDPGLAYQVTIAIITIICMPWRRIHMLGAYYGEEDWIRYCIGGVDRRRRTRRYWMEQPQSTTEVCKDEVSCDAVSRV